MAEKNSTAEQESNVSQSSPSPWRVGRPAYAADGVAYVLDGKDFEVAVLYSGIRQEVNSRLIAAAPSLLDALKRVLQGFEAPSVATPTVTAVPIGRSRSCRISWHWRMPCGRSNRPKGRWIMPRADKADLIQSELSRLQIERARLSEAAPDLLAACKFAHSVITANGVFETSEKLAIQKLEAAIAKAKGRPS